MRQRLLAVVVVVFVFTAARDGAAAAQDDRLMKAVGQIVTVVMQDGTESQVRLRGREESSIVVSRLEVEKTADATVTRDGAVEVIATDQILVVLAVPDRELLFPSAADVRSDFSRQRAFLTRGDRLVIRLEDGTSRRGTLVAIDATGISVESLGRVEHIPAERVRRVQRSAEGAVLGPLLGAAAGVPFGLALSTYAINEGGSAAGALMFPIVTGALTGLIIDRLIDRPRTLFER